MAETTGRRRFDGVFWLTGYALGLVALGTFLAPVAPIPVAVQVAQRKWARAAAVVVGTALLVGIGVAFKLGPQAAALTGGMMAVNALIVGVPVGLTVVRQMRYTRGVAFATLAALIPSGMVVAIGWSEMARVAQQGHEEIEAVLADETRQADLTEQELTVLEWQSLMAKHWSRWVAGGTFAGVLVSVCVALSVAIGWMVRRGNLLAPPGSFRTLRPPEALVWAVIGVAMLWFANERWPSELMTVAFWNLTIALATVYGLNGLSIVLYGIDVWRPHALVLAVLLVMAVVFNMMAFLPILGLFDTWGEFRRKIDTLVAAKDLRDDAPDDPM